MHVAANAWLLVLAMAWQSDDSITVVDAPPTSGENPYYVGHRAPLMPEPLLKLPVGSVRGRGWLEWQLERMAGGMFGRLPEHSHWVRPEKSAWRSKDGSGENGWEELPYWLKGLVSLAVLVEEREAWLAGDESRPSSSTSPPSPPSRRELTRLATGWLEAILASQREDGWFGPESNRAQPDLWPNMPVLWAMRTWHEATGDPRILEFLARYFRYELSLPREKLLPDSWQKVRGGDNLDVVHWLYDRTGEPWLLELAQALHEKTSDWTSGIANWHGVNFCQGFREPLQFFAQSRDPRHREATYRNYAEMMRRFGQVPGGMFGADENCREGHSDPRQAAEACSMVEFMRSFELLGAQTGETIWFDRCEDVAFNSLPAATDPDQRSLHYLTAPNLVACDEADHSPGIQNGGCMLAFSPDERYRCCQHNVVQGWPYFAEHLWFATRDSGLAAAMYAPCAVRAKAAGDVEVLLEVETEYPFESEVAIRVAPSSAVRFPVYLRVPGWCESANVAIETPDGTRRAIEVPVGASGRFLRIERTWTRGDVLHVTHPMEVRVRQFAGNHDSAAIDRGPLTYSLELHETWSRIRGADAASGEWTNWEVQPARDWNFGLVLDPVAPASSISVREGSRASVCGTCGHTMSDGRILSFTSANAPHLHARARRIPEWKVDVTGLVARLQPSPVKSVMPETTVTLVPMGCVRLRISAFPVIGEGLAAHEWRVPLARRASHVHDDPDALDDGILPKNSIDHSVPRFTFWDHLGTVEWVQYDFSKPRQIGRSSVYWFDDSGRGRCRVPKSWRLLWLDDESASGEPTWREVDGASGYGIAPDTLNEVTFTPVLTRSLRLEVTLQPGVSAGLFEWSVEGPTGRSE